MGEIVVSGALRCHVLVPHEVVGAIIDDEPRPGLEAQDLNGARYYLRDGRAVLRLERDERLTRLVALDEVWIQEPGLALKIAGDGAWRGYGPTRAWTSRPYTLKQKDAHRSTVHFSRNPRSDEFTVGVEYRDPSSVVRCWSDGGFESLLDEPPGQVSWRGCKIFGSEQHVEGVCVRRSGRPRRRWELAGKMPNIGQFYALGWEGGAGCIVNADGRTREPGVAPQPGDGFVLVWDPRGWRRMRPGQSIEQTFRVRVSLTDS